MTYEDFKASMTDLLTAGFRYTPRQAGFSVYSEKMAALADAHPEHAERLDGETA